MKLNVGVKILFHPRDRLKWYNKMKLKEEKIYEIKGKPKLELDNYGNSRECNNQRTKRKCYYG